MKEERVDNEGRAESFVRELVEERYQPLFDQVPELKATSKSFCENDLLPHTRQELLKEEGDMFDQTITAQAKRFLTVEDVAIRNIWLGNLVEQLSLTVAGIHGLGAFLVDFTRC